MTDTPTIEQRARALAAQACDFTGWKGVGLRLREGVKFPSDDPGEQLVKAFITAITEAEAIGEARGLRRGAEIANQAWEEVMEGLPEAIRKEAAERAGGGAHECDVL